MIGQDFIFCGKRLSNFGFIMAKPDEEDESGLNREIIKGNTNIHRSQAVHYGTTYTNPLTLPLFIIKFNCNNYNDMDVSMFELRKLQAWLTSSKLPQTLYLITEEGSMIEYRGIFTDISPFAYNGLHGLNLKFTCDSPFAYETKTVKIKMNDDVKITKRIFCDTDETGEFIYPLIQFTPNTSGEISFTNHNDNENTMSFTIPKKYNEVIIDCKLKRIIADGTPLSLSDVGLNIKQITDYNNVNTGIYQMYWLRLLPDINDIDIVGDGDFVITYKNLLKLGGLTYV